MKNIKFIFLILLNFGLQSSEPLQSYQFNYEEQNSIYTDDLINDVKFSPDNSMIAASYYHFSDKGNVITIWNKTGQEIQELKHNSTVKSFFFTPKSDKLAACYSGWNGKDDRTIKVWDINYGKIIGNFKGTKGQILALAVAKDNSKIIAGTWGGATIINLKNKTVSKLNYVTVTPAVAISNNGNLIACALNNNYISIWDAQSEKQLINKLVGNGYTVIFSHDDKQFISARYLDDNNILISDIESGKLIAELKSNTGLITSLAVHGSLLASGSKDGTIIFWDLKTCTEIARFNNEPVTYVEFSPNGEMFAAACGTTIRLWKKI